MSTEDSLWRIAAMDAGWAMWLLAALVVALAIDRGLVLARTYENTTRLRADLARALGQGDLLAARTCVVASRSIEARVVAAGLGALPRGAAAVAERMASEAERTRLALERGLVSLRTIAVGAPLVGLLGTVIDIRRALDGGAGASGLPNAAIGAALVPTASGLVVALAAIVLLGVIQGQIAYRMAHAEALGREMLSYVEDERRSLVQEAARIPGGLGCWEVVPPARARQRSQASRCQRADDGPVRAAEGAT